METTEDKILEYLRTRGRAAPHEITAALGVSKKTTYNNLDKLMAEGKVIKVGSGLDVVYALTGSESGIMNNELRDENKTRTTEPPLFQMRITNPVTYLRLWWKKVMGNEGVDVRFRIRPLTAFGLALILMGAGIGVGRITLPAPVVKYIPQLAPSPSPNPWKETAYTGILRYTLATKRYYLATGDGEAITLQVPSNVKMSSLVGKRVFAAGRFNTVTEVLVVAEAEDLEILPIKVVPVPVEASPAPEPARYGASGSATYSR